MYIALTRILGAHIWNSLPENIICTDLAHEPKNPRKDGMAASANPIA